MRSPISAGLALLSALAVSSCTVIIERPVPAPTPTPTLNPCTDTTGAPSAHVFFDVRIDRTVVNLAQSYEDLARVTVAGLLAAGIRPTHAVVLDLTERSGDVHPLAAWGCELGTEPTPAATLRYYAQHPLEPRQNGACATTPLVTAGKDLGALVTEYPGELNGHSGRRIFGPAPDMVLVVHLDSLPRTAGLEEPSCSADAAALSGRSSDGLATWLNYAEASDHDIPGVFQANVFHWFISTDEAVSNETFKNGCKAFEDLPVSFLDILEPSPRALYGPLAAQIQRGGARTESASLCKILSPTGKKEFLLGALSTIAGVMGTAIDPTSLAALLSGATPDIGTGVLTGPR